jgi:starvation-inducible outer membrane lipoprotein
MFKMKCVLVLSALTLAACSSVPVYKLKGYEGPEAMHRTEVIQSSKECVRAKMKPNVEYTTQRMENGKVLVPINVHCEPY